MRSPIHADQQAAGLEKRLCHAEAQLTAGALGDSYELAFWC
jgi:hypothetical protein